jgi:hypothetical protein
MNDLEVGITNTNSATTGEQHGPDVAWTTTTGPSVPSPLLLPEAAEAAAARRRGHRRRQQQQPSAARNKTTSMVPVQVVRHTHNTPNDDVVVDGVVICRASVAAPGDGPDVVQLETHQHRPYHHHHHPARTLTVPIGNGAHDNEVPVPQQQPYERQAVVGKKSNRKSLLAGCCGGGRGSNNPSERAMTSDYYDEHLGGGRQYWRDIILGVNDGTYRIEEYTYTCRGVCVCGFLNSGSGASLSSRSLSAPGA